MTDVTDVIVARSHQPDRFNSMVAGSVAVHVAAAAFLIFGPASWRLQNEEPPKTVMTISLGGAPGPRAGGMTPIAGRAVPETPKPVEPVKPVAAPPPPRARMTLPAKTVRPQPPRPQEEPRPGTTRTETGARGTGFGLSTGGGGAQGVQLDVANFCCPEYIEQMVALVQQNWQRNQGVAGSTLMKFTITRRGSIEGVVIERPSGFVALDYAAQRALLLTRLPELPAQYPNPTLGVHVTFDYQR
jgi:TonB family protein